MTGWRLAVISFATGSALTWIIGWWRQTIRTDRMVASIEAIKVTQDHDGCVIANQWLARSLVAHQEYIDYLESNRTVGDEAADHLRREAGS